MTTVGYINQHVEIDERAKTVSHFGIEAKTVQRFMMFALE